MSNTPAAAKRTVFVAITIAGGVAVLTQLSERHVPPLRIGVGVAGSAFLLSVLAEFEPAVASSLALLVLATAVFVYGGPAVEAFTHAVTKNHRPPPAAPVPSTQRSHAQ